MKIEIAVARASCAATVLVLLAACGGGQKELTGTYSLDMPGLSIEMKFRGDHKVMMSMAEFGEKESVECSYDMRGDKVTITCPNSPPRVMTLRDNALEADMDGELAIFTKR